VIVLAWMAVGVSALVGSRADHHQGPRPFRLMNSSPFAAENRWLPRANDLPGTSRRDIDAQIRAAAPSSSGRPARPTLPPARLLSTEDRFRSRKRDSCELAIAS